MSLFKPMLADKLEPPFILSPAKFPLYASPKLDGIRATVQNGIVYARSLKPIPNKWVQQVLGRLEYNGLDGELIVGDPTTDCFNVTGSEVGRRDGQPAFKFYVFDYFGPYPFDMRLTKLKEMVAADTQGVLVLVPQVLVFDPAQLIALEKEWLEAGYEGTMIRAVSSPYKQGRSTVKEGYLLKLKRFMDAEGEIVGFIEQMTNLNEAKINELGYVSRSTHKDNKKPAGMLGSFVVRHISDNSYSGVEHKVSPGCLTQDECRQVWEQRHQLVGKIVKFKYFPTGTKDKPRFPEFIGWRDEWDMSKG